jgi:alginate O-acetyltransferase complex protein AlgI
MTFSTPIFFMIFLPLCLAGFAVAGRFGRRAMVTYLVLASLIFYAAWDAAYTLLLLASVVANFLFAARIARSTRGSRAQRLWLVAGIVSNLALLCYYKYLFPLLNFFTGHGSTHRHWASVVLPLGISFFTFTQIAYLIDLKQGVAQRESLGNYALFVTFFPHLIAGPILHHKEIMPQLREERRYRLDANDLALGLTWFTMGFCKKTLIADRISPMADALFAKPYAAGATTTWHGVLVYAMQLYFDFSGYSDMAIGLARMFSIRFPMNFNSPYKATSVLDYWQRWHMTLTRYIMAYLYSPMQMWVSRRRMDSGKKVSRKAQATIDGFAQMVAAPTLITLFIAGVWHGAGVQFLLYGLLHGTYLTLNHAWRTFVPEHSRLRKLMVMPVAVTITFICVVIGDVMFRAGSVRNACTVYAGMLGRHGVGKRVALNDVLLIAVLLAIVFTMPNTQEILGEAQKEDEPNWSAAPRLRWRTSWPWCAATAAAFLLCMAYSTANSTFLYFQF